jgi:Uma2 family endonuclease
MAQRAVPLVWTVDDLDLLPDDGNRYEIIDGELFVTPAPIYVHQRAQMQLIFALGPYTQLVGLELLAAPTAVRASEFTEVQPDLLVLHQSPPNALEARWVPMPTLALAVEILSPSTRQRDRGLKRRTYLANGVAEYWTVDLRRRHVEIWRAGAESAALCTEALSWQPLLQAAPLQLDLLALFARMLDDA